MIKKRFILGAAAMVLFSIPGLYAQDMVDGNEDNVSQSYSYDLLYNTNYSAFLSLNRNMCLEYFNDTTGRSNVWFKSVTMTTYASTDSLIEHKKLKQKTVTHFNKHGQITALIVSDTIGKVKDRAIAAYDSLFHPLTARSYDFDEAKNKLELNFEVNNTYDNKGNCILTESKTYKKTYTNENMEGGNMGSDTSDVISYYTYDDKGTMIKSLSVENRQDTTIMFFTYYQNGKFCTLNRIHHVYYGQSHEMYTNLGKNYTSETYYLKLDESGKIIHSARILGKDTDENVYCAYDDQSRETYYAEYTKKKLVNSRTTEYGLENAYTVTEDAIGTTGGNEYKGVDEDDDDYDTTVSPACTTDRKTITVYNRYGFQVSKIATTTGTGKPSVSSVLDNYVFNNFDKVESDSMTEEESSEYHSSGTLTVHYYKYDNHGNLVEAVEKGGAGTESDNRSTYTYNSQNNLLSVSYYGSCLDIPYSVYSVSYYPDDKTKKEIDVQRGKTHTVFKFGEQTEKLETLYISSYGANQTVYEYENW